MSDYDKAESPYAPLTPHPLDASPAAEVEVDEEPQEEVKPDEVTLKYVGRYEKLSIEGVGSYVKDEEFTTTRYNADRLLEYKNPDRTAAFEEV